MSLCGTMITRTPLVRHHERSSSSRRAHLVCSSSSSSSVPWSIQKPPLFLHPKICGLSLSRTTTTSFNPHKLCSGGGRGGGRGRFFVGCGGGGGHYKHNPFNIDSSFGFNFYTLMVIVSSTMAICLTFDYPPLEEETNFFVALRHMPVLFGLFIGELKFIWSCYIDPKGMKKLHLERCARCRRARAEINEIQEKIDKWKKKRNRDY